MDLTLSSLPNSLSIRSTVTIFTFVSLSSTNRHLIDRKSVPDSLSDSVDQSFSSMSTLSFLFRFLSLCLCLVHPLISSTVNSIWSNCRSQPIKRLFPFELRVSSIYLSLSRLSHRRDSPVQPFSSYSTCPLIPLFYSIDLYSTFR